MSRGGVNYSSRPVSITLEPGLCIEAGFCIEPVAEALARYDKLDTFNIGQGSQFTSADFIKTLKDAGAPSPWTARRLARKRFVERLWRIIKYEKIYLRASDDAPEARAAIGKYLTFDNNQHPHLSLGYLTRFKALQPTSVAT